MAPRIAFIGAGSIGFTRQLVADLMTVDELRDSTLVLMDIDGTNLERVEQLISRDRDANGLSGDLLIATGDRAEALKNADYVFSVVRIGGLEAFETDVEIPLGFGIDQCVGDTLCAGGIMYGQRNIPFILDLASDIRKHARPDCLLLNYANPMAMNVWAAHHYGGIRVVGLCHGVQHGHETIAEVLKLPAREIEYVCAGINHQTWYTSVVHRGREMTGDLLRAFENSNLTDREQVRIDILRRFGYFSTESNGHLSEYLPWYRKRIDEIERWIGKDHWIDGETGGYLRECRERRNEFDEMFPAWMKEPAMEYSPTTRSNEHGSFIVESLETGRLYRGHFNMANNGAIGNLPCDSIVEAPGLVDATGIRLLSTGDLPAGPAGICNASITVQRLAVQAAVTGSDVLLRQAMMLDPLIGAVCTPEEIWQLVDEMLVAQSLWLPQYSGAIAAARKRLSGRHPGSTRATVGGFRRPVRTPEELRTEREHNK